jgi:hypothetical protein
VGLGVSGLHVVVNRADIGELPLLIQPENMQSNLGSVGQTDGLGRVVEIEAGEVPSLFFGSVIVLPYMLYRQCAVSDSP